MFKMYGNYQWLVVSLLENCLQRMTERKTLVKRKKAWVVVKAAKIETNHFSPRIHLFLIYIYIFHSTEMDLAKPRLNFSMNTIFLEFLGFLVTRITFSRAFKLSSMDINLLLWNVAAIFTAFNINFIRVNVLVRHLWKDDWWITEAKIKTYKKAGRSLFIEIPVT